MPLPHTSPSFIHRSESTAFIFLHHSDGFFNDSLINRVILVSVVKYKGSIIPRSRRGDEVGNEVSNEVSSYLLSSILFPARTEEEEEEEDRRSARKKGGKNENSQRREGGRVYSRKIYNVENAKTRGKRVPH